MRKWLAPVVFATVSMVSTPASADKLLAVTPSGAAEMLFGDQPQTVVGKLSSKCVDAHWTVVSSSADQVVCEAPLNVGQSVLGQLLLGNSYSTPPRRYYRFNVMPLNGITRVQASGWMELQMAFGQTKRSDFSGASFENGMFTFMGAAGGKFPVGTIFPNHVVMGFDSDIVTIDGVQHLKITKLQPGMPAEKVGLQVGDVITKIAGKSFKNDGAYLDAAAKAAETPTYQVEYLRGGKTMVATLERAYRPTWTEVVTPAAQPAATGALQVPQLSIADELTKLKKLKDDGTISEPEFDALKRKLLGEK